MSNAKNKTTQAPQQPTERSVRFNDIPAIFKDADKVLGSRLAPGTDLHIFGNSAECGDGVYIEFVNRKTGKGEYIGNLSCGIIAGNHDNFYSAKKDRTIAGGATPLYFKGNAADSIGPAIDDALERARGDNKLTATEVRQFARASSMIREAAQSGGEITSAERANILAHLKQIAPKQRPLNRL